ncbi:hypothetical protein l13_12950 [Neisseria weaveri ATCC 51223]|nr:hypothetical protein l13_12950 [Neisseria weaveri ATCC 51223]
MDTVTVFQTAPSLKTHDINTFLNRQPCPYRTNHIKLDKIKIRAARI